MSDKDPPDKGGSLSFTTNEGMSSQDSYDGSFLPLTQASQMQIGDVQSTNRKRSAMLDGGIVSISESPKKTQSPGDSIQNMYVTPGYSADDPPLKYSDADKGPFVVHISRTEPDPSAGLTLRVLKLAQLLHKNNIKGPYIILGDFNCKHTLWGSPTCDSNSAALLDMLDDLNLCVLNDGSPTRRTSPLQNSSALDLTLVSSNLISSFNWKVLDRSFGSDHFPILSTIINSYPSPSISPPLLKYRTAQADWGKFSRSLDDEISSLDEPDGDNLLEVYPKFVDLLIKAADLAIPLKNTARHKISSPPWWDSECTKAIHERNRAELTYSANLTMDNYISFKKTLAKSKRLLSKKKSQGWTKFCESLSPRSPVSLVWKRIKAFRRGMNSDSNATSNSTDSWLPAFMDRLSPPFVPAEDLFPTPNSQSHPALDSMDEPFSFPELLCALDNLKDSAPGIDGIPYSFLINASRETKMYFLKLINLIFITGVVPEAWKTQIVIPLLKPGKDPNDPSSYRPVALSSVLAKIMEHLIKNRLEWILENRNILAKSQFGFRRGLGTMDSLSILTTDIRMAFSKNQYLVGVFLDISSAYDNVNLSILRQKMLQLSIPMRLTNIICNLYMARYICVRVVLAWIPSHSGIVGNEQVDQYAKDAIQLGINTYDKSFSRDLRSNVRPQLLEIWENLWHRSQQTKGRHYGNLQPDLPSRP
ncbi:hypothetical protein MSG28_003208 [Choristoneura fumiferana]|uniref:Uncharacterized protein n=1 Tax=Choristoneura fumiferana TaxID=7141 RepID=A0ACC0KEP1_CHOFU|nr:hypothetical protein MSG28_003208 [Choristoneura fumiferana]